MGAVLGKGQSDAPPPRGLQGGGDYKGGGGGGYLRQVGVLGEDDADFLLVGPVGPSLGQQPLHHRRVLTGGLENGCGWMLGVPSTRNVRGVSRKEKGKAQAQRWGKGLEEQGCPRLEGRDTARVAAGTVVGRTLGLGGSDHARVACNGCCLVYSRRPLAQGKICWPLTEDV